MSIDHVYCINLERRRDRKESASKQFSIHGIENVEFFNATDGKLDAPEDLNISKPEWGCADSHIRVWRDIVDKGYETVLVFEDDAKISKGFINKLSLVLDETKDIEWDYINLGPSPEPFRIQGNWHSKNVQKGLSLLTHCYMIRRSGAQKLAYIDPSDLKEPIDCEILHVPMKMYYSKKPLAVQFEKLMDSFTSLLEGDIVFDRTVPFIFILKCLVVYISIIILMYWCFVQLVPRVIFPRPRV